MVSWREGADGDLRNGKCPVILNAIIHGEYQYAVSPAEKEELITEITQGLRFEVAGGQWVSPGEVAYLMFADRRHSRKTRDWWPDNTLQVSVNSQTGYGGLVWYATQARASRDEVSENIWVSDNKCPPDFDPRVVADPGIPKFFDPQSAIPIAMVRSALEEFCLLATGDRPECVEWVRGDMNGERFS